MCGAHGLHWPHHGRPCLQLAAARGRGVMTHETPISVTVCARHTARGIRTWRSRRSATASPTISAVVSAADLSRPRVPRFPARLRQIRYMVSDLASFAATSPRQDGRYAPSPNCALCGRGVETSHGPRPMARAGYARGPHPTNESPLSTELITFPVRTETGRPPSHHGVRVAAAHPHTR